MFAPLVGAVLLHITSREMASNVLAQLLREIPTVTHDACYRASETLYNTHVPAKLLSILSSSLQTSCSLWPIESCSRWIAKLYPFLSFLCSMATSDEGVGGNADEIFDLLMVATRALSHPQEAHCVGDIGEGAVELCRSGLEQLSDIAISLFEYLFT